MKTNHKYAALSLLTAVAVLGLSFGSLGFAQAVTPVTCTVANASINTNQPTILTASGGDGSNYSWSGNNLTTTNATGNQFAVSYPNVGTYTVNVTSAGQTGSCTVNVTAVASSGTLMCSPAVQTVNAGQTATVSASGGNNTYSWSATDLSITNPTGSGFSATYATPGLHALTVSSNGATASCEINVIGSAVVTTPPVTTPGLPDTGGGYDK
jgi:hypothetical protein